MLQFQRFHHARRVVAGIELAAQIRKDQYDFNSVAAAAAKQRREVGSGYGRVNQSCNRIIEPVHRTSPSARHLHRNPA